MQLKHIRLTHISLSRHHFEGSCTSSPFTSHSDKRDEANQEKKRGLHRLDAALSLYIINIIDSYSYSCQLLIWISSNPFSQNASIKAEARRALVISGMLWSIAPRRIT